MKLAHLKQISDLKYQKSELAIAKILGRENTLRAELKRLQGLAHQTHSMPASDAELRAIGGDVIWLQWLASAQRRLNIELAQVLAQKENLMVQHRAETGKKAVADKLVEQDRLTSRQKRAQQALEKTIETSLVRSAFNNPGGQSRQ